jgi:ketosteroid isomerase-like protein
MAEPTTTRRNLEAAFASRQLARLVELMDEGVVLRGVPTLHDHEGEEPEHLDVPVCRTRDEVRQVMQGFLNRGGDADPVIVVESGDSMVIEIRAMRLPIERADVQFPKYQVFTFRGGRIALIQDYLDRQGALSAIGLET